MTLKRISVIIPTYNRPEKLSHTVDCFLRQDISPSEYEIIVVDDASDPLAILPQREGGAECRLIRLDTMLERAVARSTGVALAQGEVVLFSDDDMGVDSGFLGAHLRAQDEWPGALVVGRVLLPPDALAGPGVRFRQRLELRGIPLSRGLVKQRNFCTAANMSIRRDLYLELGGFASDMVGIEDQDFAMRHTKRGGAIVFAPDAMAIHRDDWLDFASFCRRQEWGSECTVALRRRYPEMHEGHERHLVNGPVSWFREPLAHSVRKVLKAALGRPLALQGLFAISGLLERSVPESALLERVYRLLLGIHLLRGYRNGLRRF